jgi:uracil-DNA glycosylase
VSSAVPTDEIYERYLQKAISEINELGHEIGRAGDATHVPVLGSGHPLADVFLLKHSPKPQEIQEGVAFFGRAGDALKKSLQKLNVDAMAVYGTNCLKFGGESFEEAAPWLVRELHIVQPKLLVLMGEDTVEFVNRLEFPLSDPVDAATDGLQRFTATVEGLVVPDIDTALDEAPAKTAFWNSFKAVGSWYSELPPY